MSATIGCVGLGVFGAPLARRLQRAGFGVMIHDIHVEALRYFLMKHGGDMADNPRLMGALCDVTICVLPNAKATRAAAIGPLGLADGLKDGKTCVLVDLGTTSAAEARALAEELASRGVHYVEAPARGSPEDARDGKTVIPFGCDAAIVERVTPVLAALSPHARHVGDVGAAHTISSLVEFARAASLLALAEAAALGKHAGVTPDALRDWCAAEGLVAPALANLREGRTIDSGHTFGTTLASLSTLDAMIAEHGLTPRHAALVANLWREAAKKIGAQRDITDIGRFLDADMRPPETPAG